MPGRIDLTMGFNTRGIASKKARANAYRIYVLGDFSGRSNSALSQRNIQRIDSDTFDQVMTQIRPSLNLDAGLTLHFESIVDFHPDAWFNKIRILADLLELKKALSNPKTAAQAAAKIQSFIPIAPNENLSAQTQQADVEREADILQRLLGKAPEPKAGQDDTVEKLIERVVSPYIVQDIEPQYQALIDVIDGTISQFLRTLLHRQDFKSLESLWRATEALVNEEYADEQRFFLVDISQAELMAAVHEGGSEFKERLLAHVQLDDEERDVLLISDFSFTGSVEDAELLKFLSASARACGGCFLGAADQSLIDSAIFGESQKDGDWARYRSEINADSVVLAYPRYLLRLPYGLKLDPIETLAFEECSEVPVRNELLWGNPALLCARALIRMTEEDSTDNVVLMSDVPVFSYTLDDEPVLQPGTETLLNETQVNVLLSKGITPLIGFRQRQGVQLPTISTLADR
ncbi:type VI secretion system contractile sheath large subunit [Methylotuvimicrobium sp. KM2]|uniref:type VI secretion system contractile sheath domain-containing protein n=1 Tax=Methylotuvimicrobium sp. KM2 TaxID=3133976 RepID=UPI0031019094